MQFSSKSGSSSGSQKSELQAISAQSLEILEIWSPLQAEIVRSVVEAILETSTSRLFRRFLGSRYLDKTMHF